ncbi:hypothetical protein KUTeg_014266 [Tegillarca granosa]|uniref:Sushi domain-containing protein n=1 Tax=Tegillarca granosa TaxID=220873 RepID=A0ABQ9EZL1_TEGGR|nr:hypothetical protein KUTeg_014266 [Tegillarca granosa]
MIEFYIYTILTLFLSLFLQKSLTSETDFNKHPYKVDEKSKCADVPLPNIINGNIQRFSNEAQVTCNDGFKLVGSAKIICKYNKWEPIPKCVQEVDPAISYPCPLPHVEHASVVKFADYLAIVTCNEGFKATSYDNMPKLLSEYYITCYEGIWNYEYGKGNKDPSLPQCSLVQQSFQSCFHPPKIPHAVQQISDSLLNFEQMYMTGETVNFECEEGYYMVESWKNYLTCNNGRWEGIQPVCLEMKVCEEPTIIRNGRWSIKQVPMIVKPHSGNNFPVGSEVQYECYNGFKMVGYPVIVCMSNKQWSHHAPQCGLVETNCPSIDVPNGICKCDNKHDLHFCEPFFTDMEVRCTCQAGYRYVGPDRPLRCTADGNWNAEIPTCVKYSYRNDADKIYPSEASDKSDVISDSSEGTHMNTLAIVIATACSVLGVLLFIMVLMFFRRRKPRPRLYHQVGGAPPPYTRVHSNSLDEHDRVALIGYETAPRLPSYEEATRSNARVHRSDIRVSNDYRPLPHIPGTVRNSIHTGGPPHSPQHSTDRHSIITTSTINRDALSEMFGSIDTVNVSMSDASTSVTVDTLDSGTSRPSNGSERATAGSLSSSQENITTEDAPLLEHRDRNDEETTHEELEIRSTEEENKDQS